jgi:hypothetical protein
MLVKEFFPFDASHAIFAIENNGCPAIGVDDRAIWWIGIKLSAGLLAACAITNGSGNKAAAR